MGGTGRRCGQIDPVHSGQSGLQSETGAQGPEGGGGGGDFGGEV